MLRLRLSLCALLLLAACQTSRPAPGPRVEVATVATDSWTRIATSEDVERLGRLDALWPVALAAARGTGFGRRIAAEGPLLVPAAALPRPAPSPGTYMCRLVRIGAAGRGQPAFAAFRPFFCFVGVSGDQLSITKPEGSERPAGYLWDDGNGRRMVFLGSFAPGRGAPVGYGEDRARDAAGIFERVADFRYRLVIPARDGAASLDIFELVPAPQ